jgi:hypothetical protein
MAQSEAHKRATIKYDLNNYWRPTIRFRKEYEEVIRKYAGDSLNGFIADAVMEKIERMKLEEK